MSCELYAVGNLNDSFVYKFTTDRIEFNSSISLYTLKVSSFLCRLHRVSYANIQHTWYPNCYLCLAAIALYLSSSASTSLSI